MECLGDVENQAKSNTKEASENENKSVKTETDQKTQYEQDIEAIKKKATLLFLQGKRSIYIRDYQAALVALSESCQLFSQIFPEQDDALADPYFYYGKALLEVARNESDVLGDQVQDKDDEDDDEDDDDDDEDDENDDDDNDNDEDDEDEGEEKTEQENKASGKTDFEKGKDSLNNENGTDSRKEEKPEGIQGSGSGEDENGEINDLQLSWEYLELAKLIYLKKADANKDIAIKLAETYLCLGENGLESENYSTAIEDIKRALELQKKHLREEDRRIAETYYQLGVAHSLDQNYDEAIESFRKSIEQLEKKISSLEMRKKIGDKKTEEEEKDAFYTMDGEISEIKTVIKDVEEKIKDMLESKNKVKAELMKQVYKSEQPSLSSTENNQGSSSKIPATDISHLIKRKRKNEESSAGEEKKLKTEE